MTKLDNKVNYSVNKINIQYNHISYICPSACWEKSPSALGKYIILLHIMQPLLQTTLLIR